MSDVPPPPPPPPPMAYQAYAPGWAPQPKNGFGITALVCGLVGSVVGLIPFFFFWLSFILGVVALVFGLLGLSRVKSGEANNKAVAIAGTVFACVAIVLSVVWIVAIFGAAEKFSDGISRSVTEWNACVEQHPDDWADVC